MINIGKLIEAHSPEKESLGIRGEKVLIKQLSRRIYGTIKNNIIQDRENTKKLLKAVFG